VSACAGSDKPRVATLKPTTSKDLKFMIYVLK
jgi:hypothetical protein